MSIKNKRILKSVVIIVCVIVGVYGFIALKEKSRKVSSHPPLINTNPLLKDADRSLASSSSKSKRARRRKNTVLIKIKADASDSELQALKNLYNEFDLKHEKNLLNGAVVRLRVSKKIYENQEENIVNKIKETGAVDFSEPDYIVPPSFVPTDSLYSQQWHHTRINSERAWDFGQGNSNVLVAVCDAGFDLYHPDLVGSFVLPGYNTVKDNDYIDDINDHGTMTSGVLAATGNNNQGVAGMTWKIKLLPIQISDQADGVSTYSDVAECINYAKDRGAKVVNLSYDYAYTSAIVNEAALAMRNSGGLVVVAAGNSSVDISPWGPSPNMIVAGATDSNDSLTWFSNFGATVDLFAPGQDIYSTMRENSYGILSGTSFSTPVTAGTVALLYSLNSSWSADQVENFLLSNLSVVGNIRRLNAGAALQAAAQSATPIQPIILDNLGPNVSDGSHISKGKWCNTNQAGFYGIKSITSCSGKLDSYRFVPSILVEKTYAVFIRYLSKSSLGNQVPIKVNSSSGITTKVVNMRKGGGTWVLLGNFNLKAGTSNYIEVSDASGLVNVDGVKFEAIP